MTPTTVFIVYHGFYGHIDDIEAVFDTIEQVNAFKKRFAKNEPLHVVKKKLNPKFISNPQKTPFLICFNSENLKPLQVTLLFEIADCKKASKDTVEKKGSLFYIYLFASNKTQAIINARDKRDELLQHM
ncbi:hypothetical protein [Mucilaginibacter sp. UR6-11]|uniref:hypothetical protein n=1 Tax=Mucilaginibacter sp. UR6-11 TaxID=1435644 RepID=UPI001E584FE7|nr:hypothetical protein [Mucilaginibacter sp. UR6-11]MCC8423663.1 hypothetical protein [Mucilaginibacter sp. UR6-11]